ncbi:mechanosensitive ion channel family protein [Cucumibacter marinus]|uniref:mechanosensitive ion channel family protein n=1 Tax=Cucumibacter marinus TaxID=1121252 RepID=UPI00041C40BE|nr:mechanosensitive ion channel domain-containing protein [Cucumibacter marinus]
MDALNEQIAEFWTGLLAALESQGLRFDGSFLGWTIVQLAIIVLCVALALVASRLFTPRFETWIRSLTLGPRRLRFLATVLRRVHLIFLTVFLWLGVVAMQAYTWSSRSYFLSLVTSLVTAWLVISISSRIIRSRTLARLVAVVAWTLAALNILGIYPQTMVFLDSLAIQFNEFRLSALMAIQAAIVFSLLAWLATLLSRFVEQQIQGIDELTPTMRVLLGKLVRVAILILAGLIGLSLIGLDFTVLTVLSGAIGLGLGFGLQKVVSNLVSGVILLLDKSIKPGDVISVGDTFGWITSLNARYVSVTMRDGREFLIPNEDLITQQVQNWSFANQYVRLDINFGVSYEADPHEVKRLAVEAARKHKRVVSIEGRYNAVCHVVGFGDSSVDFVLRFWIKDPAGGLTNVRGDIFLNLWDTFKENGIAIPYPHREVFVHQAADKSSGPID